MGGCAGGDWGETGGSCGRCRLSALLCECLWGLSVKMRGLLSVGALGLGWLRASSRKKARMFTPSMPWFSICNDRAAG